MPDSVDDVFETVTLTVAVVRLPAASRATAESVCAAFEVLEESQVKVYGGVARSAPSVVPSSWNWTPTTPTLSDAVADTVIAPVTVAWSAGAVTETTGAAVSP